MADKFLNNLARSVVNIMLRDFRDAPALHEDRLFHVRTYTRSVGVYKSRGTHASRHSHAARTSSTPYPTASLLTVSFLLRDLNIVLIKVVFQSRFALLLRDAPGVVLQRDHVVWVVARRARPAQKMASSFLSLNLALVLTTVFTAVTAWAIIGLARNSSGPVLRNKNSFPCQT
jgi:hypothetical protein